MDRIDEKVLKEKFPKIEPIPGKKHRYNRDDILSVLEFMKAHPTVKLINIEEYSGVSLGTLVSWRKKFGEYVGIKTKSYANHGDLIPEQSIAPRVNVDAGNSDLRPISQISLSLIQELKRMHDRGSAAEISVNDTVYRVDDQHLYILGKR